ncbi:MAG TPA: PAAR domain-containing protein [Gemmatimonadaceae bacterium]|nr:PAAR domain-containing protein [Gemmatimonadaceae bacterium]
MGRPAAKKDDRITADDNHLIREQVGSVVTQKPLNLHFNGFIDGGLSSNVMINGKPAARMHSTATNNPKHELQLLPNQSFVAPPSNQGTITDGSGSVRINGQPAARDGDPAETCHDLPGAAGKVVVAGNASVRIG